MCNIAGYVGTKQAAPIIVEMLRKQEGWDSGYYTGIATIHEDKVYMEKCVGSLQMLLEQEDVSKFPGNIGIIHGRTPGTEGKEYAHPFVGKGGDLVYVANGYGGVFADPDYKKLRETYEALLAEGYACPTYMEGDFKMLPGGAKVHGSDLKCQEITYYVDKGMTAQEAMEKSFCERPGEIVGLLLNRKTPDRITFARINYPMFVGIAEHGIYLATTPQAFPEDAKDITLLPQLSCGEVYRDRYTVKPFTQPPCKVASLTPAIYAKSYAAVVEALALADMDHGQLDKLVRPFITEGDCAQESALDYQILYDLEKEGRLETKLSYLPGVQKGTLRPKFTASLIK